MKRWLFAAVTCLCLLLARPAAAERVNRLLLVGCDRFATMAETTPASANNVGRMAEVLGVMDPAETVVRVSDVAGVDDLAALARETFREADEDDVSYFYLSTHGVWDEEAPEGAALLLSDGQREERLTAAALKEIFDPVPGTKVLILDACHSGALIGKGISALGSNPFAGGAYKVICSSGGAEESWFWAAADRERSGAGYFSGALANGLGAGGAFGADSNRDGLITLSELKVWLLNSHGASTPRVYPEEDGFAVLSYDAGARGAFQDNAVIAAVSWDTPLLDQAWPRPGFTYTLLREAQIAYQVILLDRDSWQFDTAELLWDNTEGLGYGLLSPGVKHRAISISREDEESGGYALVQILALTDGVPQLLTSHVLCVPPLTGDPMLEAEAPEAFSPDRGEEAGFIIRHRLPCVLTAAVTDESGAVVCRLLTRMPSRPERLSPAGTFVCWNGCRTDGTPAPDGSYRLEVRAWVGDEEYRTESAPFRLEGGAQERLLPADGRE